MRKRSNRRSKAGYVYVFQKVIPLGRDHYKIGKTRRQVTSRLKSAQTGSSYKIVEHSRYKVRDRHAVEAALHKRFERKRIQPGTRNEWFRLNTTDLLAIQIMLIGRQEK